MLIEPGAVKTGFDSFALGKLRKIDFPDDYKNDMQKLDKYLTKMYDTCPGVENTVKDMVKAITLKKPKAIYRTTFDSKVFTLFKKIISEKAYDRMVAFLIK